MVLAAGAGAAASGGDVSPEPAGFSLPVHPASIKDAIAAAAPTAAAALKIDGDETADKDKAERIIKNTSHLKGLTIIRNIIDVP
jgi:hypothetical protein